MSKVELFVKIHSSWRRMKQKEEIAYTFKSLTDLQNTDHNCSYDSN